MTMLVPLSDYFNTLVDVQMAARVTRALHAEIFHHLNNSAAVLIHYQRRDKTKHQDPDAFIGIASEIAQEASVPAQDIMDRIAGDEAKLNVGTLLVDLLYNPDLVTADNLEGLTNFHTCLDADADALRDIRISAEIKMLERSGMVDTPINMDAPYAHVTLGEYFDCLVRAQMAMKVASAQRTEITEQMAHNAAALKTRIMEFNAEGLSEFKDSEHMLVIHAHAHATSIMAPLNIDAQELQTPSTRLVSLFKEQGRMTEEYYDGLCALREGLRGAREKLRDLRKTTEVNLLRVSGLVQQSFTI